MLVCEQLQQLISSFFYKHLGYFKVIEDLEEKKRRRRGSGNKKIARELIKLDIQDRGPLFIDWELGLSKKGCHESMPKSLFGIPKNSKKILIMWRRNLKSHMLKDFLIKIRKK